MIVAWIHEEQGREAPFIVVNYTASRFLDVLGCNTDMQGHRREFERRMSGVDPKPEISYAVPGFVKRRSAGCRWLTNQEISEGVTHAFFSNEIVRVVGELAL